MRRVHIGVMTAIASMLGAVQSSLPQTQRGYQPTRGAPTTRHNKSTLFIHPKHLKAKARALFRHQVETGLVVVHSHTSPRKRTHVRTAKPHRHCNHVHLRTRYRRGKPPKGYCGDCRTVFT
jgi:hypothetical protein